MFSQPFQLKEVAMVNSFNMPLKKNLVCLLLICFSPVFLFATSQQQIDSLKKILPALSPSSQLMVLSKLSKLYSDSSKTIATQYANKGIAIAYKLQDTLSQIEFLLIAAEIESKDGQNEKAISKIISALELSENSGSSKYIVVSHLKLGQCYTNIGQYEFAINYLNKALNIAQKNKDKIVIIEIFNSLGNALSKSGVNKRNEAENYYLRGLSLAEEINNQALISKLSNNIANIYLAQGNTNKSLLYYQKALDIAVALQDEVAEAFYNNNIGALYLKNNEPEKAERYQLKALAVAEKTKELNLLINVYSQLSKTYEKQNKYVKAYNYKSKLLTLIEKLNSENSVRQIAEMQAKYESLNRQKEISELQMKQKHNESLLSNYKNGLFTLVVIIILSVALLLILAVFLRLRKKNNFELEEKNKLIEKQNNKITDSINYAQRIQNSILPGKTEIDNLLKESFLLFIPKDIVSGDFYWISKTANKLLIAVADCTGHGVPGAFMSMIGNTLLNEIISNQPHLTPGKILNLLNKRISATLRQKQGEISSQDDGMDIAICSLDYATNKLCFAGANHSIYMVHNTTLTEIRGDVFPVGGVFSTREINFAEKEIELVQGTMLYLFTDGYKDQFGGEQGQKFKSSKFEKIVSEIASQSMEIQKQRLLQEHIAWKGNLSQLDDILILGIRL
jgi:serine phosphatase RsbU (regulator of sigma subunit)